MIFEEWMGTHDAIGRVSCIFTVASLSYHSYQNGRLW
jgi:hypothetical protein